MKQFRSTPMYMYIYIYIYIYTHYSTQEKAQCIHNIFHTACSLNCIIRSIEIEYMTDSRYQVMSTSEKITDTAQSLM